MRLVSIVEGHGDVASISALIGKISTQTSIPLYPIKSIRTGGWSHLQRAGELERYLELALSHQPDRVLILSDLDDHCPVDEAKKFNERILGSLGNRTTPVEVAFAVREFECWLLHSIQKISERFSGNWNLDAVPNDPEAVRGAKEALSKIMKSRYKETIHQSRFTSAIDVNDLYKSSRSFRRMVRACTGLTYPILE